MIALGSRLGGSNAEAGCGRKLELVLRVLVWLVLRAARMGMPTVGGGAYECLGGEPFMGRSETSEPSRRMTGSAMMGSRRGVTASDAPSVEPEGDRNP